MLETKNDKKNRPRMVSLFSGCGGLDLGFKKAGFDVIWANDFDSDAQAVYNLNVGENKHEVQIDTRDILTVGADDIPDCDILTAGFPCQPFSNAGNRKGVHDSRGMLYKECLRIISKKIPKVIVFENVKGLLSTKYIDGRNLSDVIIEDLSNINDIGYDVVYKLLNASDYGVPQNRHRVFFVGIRKDIGKTFVFPDKLPKNNLTVGHVLSQPHDVPNQVHWELSPQALEMISYIPEGGSWKDVPYEHLAPRFQKIRDQMKKYHSPNFYRRFARTEICGTMTASAQPENCGIVHPLENRRYTIREAARIQTFPDDFLFIDDTPRNVTAMYKVIGNAVPVNLAKNIAESIMTQVFEEKCLTAENIAESVTTQVFEERCLMMNTDKAYIFGLMIGGGIFGNPEDPFIIHLPYNKWGDLSSNPARVIEIQRDIMSVVRPMLKTEYGLDVQYQASSKAWDIRCDGDTTALVSDLSQYGITCTGRLCKQSSIDKIVSSLIDETLKCQFIAGLADTIGSTTPSHRRFADDKQIVSFEISGGCNFTFVCQLCRLLYSINCFPDQILWNHPNFHCSHDPYYTQWTKGFKLRVLIDQFSKFASFHFRSKAISVVENKKKQSKNHSATKCEDVAYHVTPTSCHPAESDARLPDNIRNGHYLHYRHVCAVLGCNHAPYEKILKDFSRVGKLVNPFPIISKKSYSDIEKIIKNDPLLQREYTTLRLSVRTLFEDFQSDNRKKMYGKGADEGYPLAEILQAAAFDIAYDNELSGMRPKGSYKSIIERHLDDDPNLEIEIRKPDLLTPFVLVGNGRGAFVGAENPVVYERLVSQDPNNKYKIIVRPITEEDLL